MAFFRCPDREVAPKALDPARFLPLLKRRRLAPELPP
jgi:hypothetical protein